MPPELQSIETELRQAVSELRAAAATRSEQDGMQAEKLERINAEIDRLSSEQAEMVRRMRGPQRTEGPATMEPDEARARAAVIQYLRRGDAGLTTADRDALDLNRKALSVDSDPDGGYLVTPAQSARIATIVTDLNPIRALATVETITTDSIEGLADEDDAGAGWVSERQSRPGTTTPKLGQWRIPVHEIYAAPKATQKLLDDSGIDVEAWLSRKVGEAFAVAEGEAFLNGDGVGKPRGLMTYPAGTARGKIEQVPTGAAAAIAAAGIVNIVYALKGAYGNGAAWGMNRATIGKIRGLRDDSGATAGTGQFLWQPGFGGQPQTLMGYPIYEAPSLDNVGAGKLVAFFGNLRAAYTIVDRQGIRVLRDPYTAKPYVELYTTKRVGGDVITFEAVKLLKVAAS